MNSQPLKEYQVFCLLKYMHTPLFFWAAPSAFRLVTNFEAYLRTSGESNHHRKSVRDVERHRPTIFFFRPAPLWLSPGRRTLSCWWTNYANAFTVSLFGGSKVEQNHYKVVPVPKRKTNKDTTKNKHPQPTPQTTPNKNKTQKGTWHDGSKKQWHQVLLN